MEKLQVTAKLKIHPGKLQEFKKIATACLNSVREKDQGTLQYDWFSNDDQTEFYVREIYANSNALLAHIDNLGDMAKELFNTCEFSSEIFGNPSEKLLKVIAGFDLKVYPYFQGLNDKG